MKLGRPRNQDTFDAITRLRAEGRTWAQIADELHYVDAVSAAGTYWRMRKRRGLP